MGAVSLFRKLHKLGLLKLNLIAFTYVPLETQIKSFSNQKIGNS